MYRVFRLPSDKLAMLDAVYQDNLAGRQSITAREARTLSLGGGGSLVLVEGSEEGVARAEAVLKDVAAPLTGADAEAAYRAFRSQDDEAASGLGLVFGE